MGRLGSIIGRQARHLTLLLDDLLDVSRLTAGKVALHRQPVDLREVAARALGALDEAGRTTAHVLSLTGESAVVEGDPTRLEQVLRNLLDNALKYTPAGGRIELSVAREGEAAVLRVRDSGIGIAAELLPRVFELFVQADQSVDRHQGGLGLGLTLVRRLVELHGGAVLAASPGPGQGSEFVVRLPRLSDAQPRLEAPRVEVRSPRPRRIVLVEDQEDARDALRLWLEGWGHQVNDAADGKRGLDLIVTTRPDLAVIDVGLPGLDGYEVARAVRAEPGGEAVHLVALTGYGQPEDRRRAREAGFSAFLVKPVDPEALLRVLGEVESGQPKPRL
jgi:CheY-like chemotaxis protein/two-component sensor histidine kinase